jgi:hypothetical protein
MLKKTTLAVIGLAASGFASAGTMGPVCTPGNVTVPCVAKQWDLGIQALYLRAIYGTAKAYEQVSSSNYSEIDKDWNWGFRAEGSYHFNTGNDVTIDWTHYSGDGNQSGFIGVMPLFPFVSTYQMISQNRLDQVNLVMGQHVDVGLVKKMRFYGGLQYANIQANATDYYTHQLQLAPPFNSVYLFDNTDFKGLGPVVGIDYSYDITNALSITANGEGSILSGTSRYSVGYVGQPIGLVLASVSGTKKSIVPGLAAKLGLNYAYNMAQGVMNFEGGYQALNYFNVLQTQSLQNLNSTILNADYGLYGPYIGVKYLGNA